jgi:hypothetical protein
MNLCSLEVRVSICSLYYIRRLKRTHRFRSQASTGSRRSSMYMAHGVDDFTCGLVGSINWLPWRLKYIKCPGTSLLPELQVTKRTIEAPDARSLKLTGRFDWLTNEKGSCHTIKRGGTTYDLAWSSSRLFQIEIRTLQEIEGTLYPRTKMFLTLRSERDL